MKILSLNTWNTQRAWKERWEAALAEILEHRPEIVLFQEFISPDFARVLSERLGMHEIAFPDPESGLMTLSKLPSLETASLAFTNQLDEEEYRRSMLVTEYDVGDKRLAVLNTHLSWRLEDSQLRQSQILEILTYLDLKYPQTATIAGGDFNAPDTEPEIALMSGRGGFSDTYRSLHPGQKGYTWSQENPYAAEQGLPQRRLDYLFARNHEPVLGAAEACEILFRRPGPGGIYASDHFGIVTRFAGADLKGDQR